MARYSDIDLDFFPNPISGDVSVRTDGQAVVRSIKNIIFTMTGEKKFNPNFGGDIRRMMFEPIDPITTLKIEEGLARSIKQFEPRAILGNVTVIPQPDENSYECEFTFRLRNDPRPITTVITLERVR
jgi:phage baseplate assembly protein W